MGDVLAFRMRQRPVRAAAATSTLVVSFFYLLAQMAGAGGLVALLLGVTQQGRARPSSSPSSAPLMIVYVLIGGMRGTTWVQIIKAVLLIAGAGVMTIWVLAKYGFNLSALLGDAVARAARQGREAPRRRARSTARPAPRKLDFISLGLALVLGTAGLPHILMRFYTVPTAKDARRSVVWAIWPDRHLLPVHAGARASAPRRWSARTRSTTAPGGGQHGRPAAGLRARRHRSLLGIIAAVAFATILAVVAGLTITASASFAHDIYANVIKQGRGGRRARRGGVARHHRGRHRRRRDPRRHPRQRPEHRLPGGAGLRGRGLGEPADDPLLAVLEAVQHHGRAVEHLRRPRRSR